MGKKHTSRREFVRTIGAGAAMTAVPSLMHNIACSKGKRPPNFVLIYTDDQGYGDVGVYGAAGFTTPNLDRMAAEGMRFTDFHVTQAVCSASRASLLTGCYAERVGIQGALMPWASIGLHPDEDTIADVLRRRGYRCGMVGKWHLGHQRPFLPLQQGFDDYFGLPYSNDMWPVGYDGQPARSGHKLFYPPLPLIDGEEPAAEIRTLQDQDTLTKRYTERAVQFIRNNAQHPFFMYIAHSMPHVPLGVSGRFRGQSAQGMYGDVIMEIDWSVGEILRTLSELNLEENTLVIFTSDNGPWLSYGNHAGTTGSLREGKGTAWEGGVRVPCIMRWPGRIPAARVCDKLTATIDILPTLAHLAGAALPERPIDGVNLWPLLKGDEAAEPRDRFYYYYGHELRAVRQGPWKLIFPHTYQSWPGEGAGADGWPGKYGRAACGLELYNLRRDVGEEHDVAAEHPQ
ncbi:sulfatase, partial [candidate division KSB1 bacterium]|nr:sulfatase [candidate division KSB1 bacterium]